jgi:hypothetical protein
MVSATVGNSNNTFRGFAYSQYNPEVFIDYASLGVGADYVTFG